jgi:hypothetical protein
VKFYSSAEYENIARPMIDIIVKVTIANLINYDNNILYLYPNESIKKPAKKQKTMLGIE